MGRRNVLNLLSLMQMQNRMAVLMCNLKPAKMRGVVSQAMVMCASSPDKVEILDPPSGAVPGDRVTFQGFPGTITLKNRLIISMKLKWCDHFQPHRCWGSFLAAEWVSDCHWMKPTERISQHSFHKMRLILGNEGCRWTLSRPKTTRQFQHAFLWRHQSWCICRPHGKLTLEDSAVLFGGG